VKDTYIAFALQYCEASCGCDYTRSFPVYDRTGNQYKRFTNRNEAELAAQALMDEIGYDNWNVI
jgi:hypothetical protein